MLQKLSPQIQHQILAPVFRADARLLTLLTAFGHEKLAPESGVEFRPVAPISGECDRGFILVDVLVVNEVVGEGGQVGAVRRGEATVGDDELKLRVPQHRSVHIARDRLTTHHSRRETQLAAQTASGRPTAAVVAVARHHELARLVHHTQPLSSCTADNRLSK